MAGVRVFGLFPDTALIPLIRRKSKRRNACRPGASIRSELLSCPLSNPTSDACSVTALVTVAKLLASVTGTFFRELSLHIIFASFNFVRPRIPPGLLGVYCCCMSRSHDRRTSSTWLPSDTSRRSSSTCEFPNQKCRGRTALARCGKGRRAKQLQRLMATISVSMSGGCLNV